MSPLTAPPSGPRAIGQLKLKRMTRTRQAANAGRLRIGIDIVSVDEVASSLVRFGDRFTGRVFTPSEASYCNAAPGAGPASRFATRSRPRKRQSRCCAGNAVDGLAQYRGAAARFRMVRTRPARRGGVSGRATRHYFAGSHHDPKRFEASFASMVASQWTGSTNGAISMRRASRHTRVST
jgi:hypothetical protein